MNNSTFVQKYENLPLQISILPAMIIWFILGIINFIASIITIYALLKSKPMKQFTLILVIQLNIFYVWDNAFFTPTALYHIIKTAQLKPETIEPLHCYSILVVYTLATEAQIPLFFILSIDRFLATVFPMLYETHSRYLVYCGSLVAWMYSFLLNLLGFFNLNNTPYVSICLYRTSLNSNYYNLVNYFNIAWSTGSIILYILSVICLKIQMYVAIRTGVGNIAEIKTRMGDKAVKTLALIALLHFVTIPVASGGSLIASLLELNVASVGPYLATLYRQDAICSLIVYYFCLKKFRSQVNGLGKNIITSIKSNSSVTPVDRII